MVKVSNDFLHYFFLFITTLGSAPGVAIISLLLLVLPFTRRHYGYPASIAVFSSFILNTATKAIYARPRPSLQHLVHASGYSFPSGHAMNNSTLYFS